MSGTEEDVLLEYFVTTLYEPENITDDGSNTKFIRNTSDPCKLYFYPKVLTAELLGIHKR